ncbi:MAG: sugar transferase, partial [Verrucomicrobiaceae bacterium]
MRMLFVPAVPTDDHLAFSLTKRIIDVLIASLALFTLFPVFVIVSFLIWLEDRGPILYRQARIGRFGVPFWFYKFRSMRVDAERMQAQLLSQSDVEGVAFKMKRDPRITRIGRFIRKYSIDEMPQLLSVLFGHMSIVGPRPHLPIEVATYG